ncbi:MAG TPA: SH3 domain-containing protein [Chlamydiales bacterium]|nr:SH3 domain-containing protein [Chlamydiales bacterium]
MKRLFYLCTLPLACTFSAFADSKPAAKPIVDNFSKTFTGKVLGNKVRLRTKPDFDGAIVREMNKNDLLLVLGEESDFYAVQPPRNTKAYVFRSYIIDNTVEASKVNVRLGPNVESPIIGQLHAGQKVEGVACLHNNKWLEIAAPSNSRFYISKEFVTSVGGPDLFAKMEKKKEEVVSILNLAYLMAEAECKKVIDEMNPKAAIAEFEKIINHYSEFEDELRQAKEGLLALEDNYLKKKVLFLEGKTVPEKIPDVSFPKVAGSADVPNKQDPNIWQKRNYFSKGKNLNNKMKYWQGVEETLYSSWSNYHEDKKPDDFYVEQKLNAATIKGLVDTFDVTLKNRPGDYVLKENNVPVAYLYSTQVDLDKWLGKKVNVVVAPRPNNHFAFPAYYVFEVND